MPPSTSGQFGSRSLLALLALGAGSKVGAMEPLRVDQALIGGTPVKIIEKGKDRTTSQVGAETGVAAQAAAPNTSIPPAEDSRAPLQVSQPLPQATPAGTEKTPAGTAPPIVADTPPVAPTWSAQLSAGMLPNPDLRQTSRIEPHSRFVDEELPSFITANQIRGKNDVQVIAEGDVELRKRNTVMNSDRMTYWQASDEIEAEGRVSFSSEGDRIRGPKMRMKMKTSTGFFEQPDYRIRRNKIGGAATLWTGEDDLVGKNLSTGQGHADRMEFLGEGQYQLKNSTYSTCTPPEGQQPDWFVRTTDLRLNYDTERGVASHGTLYFKGAPILYSPWLNFSLNNNRKSGLLTPTPGSTSRGGVEYTQPFYWDIAPNLDATISPRIMSKRGTLLNGEFRYLQRQYGGTIRGQFLNNDRLTHQDRSSYAIEHYHDLGAGFSASVNLNGASDDTFFSDLSNSSTVIAQTNLLRQVNLNYGASWWSAGLMAQSYQTLKDPTLAAVTDPYRRLPQFTLNAARSDLPLGMNFTFSGEDVTFRHPHPTREEARRTTLFPQISLPLQTASFYLTPKVGVHATHYSQRERVQLGVPKAATRSVPIYSLDSGLTFERPVKLLDTQYTQTLEPRLYYLKVPARDQDHLPVFDTALSDFNFAQIFAENRYSGNDRVGDADQATAMLTSRILAEDGSELMRGAFGQRFYFRDQTVGLPAFATLPSEVKRTDRKTDYLGAFSGRILPKTWFDTGIQYSPRYDRMERFNIGARYQPEMGKVLNAGYRYSRDILGQVDLSAQWPIGGGWHGVGRLNYSTKERRVIETIGGLELDGGCWIARVVVQRLSTQRQTQNTALFFQIELNDFAKIGANPLDVLKRNVPGYGIIRQADSDTPSQTP